MNSNGSPVDRLIEEFSRLPGIGKKTAARLAFHLLKADAERVQFLAEALLDLKGKIRACSVCFNFSHTDPCPICSDAKRDTSIICVVEEPADLAVIERSGEYRGRYHVLGGVLAPLDGVGPGELRVKELLARAKEGIKEVILATNPSTEGEATATYLARELKALNVRVTRIARGVPVGGDLEFVDQGTLLRAFADRQVMD
ncbi:MAG: recombination mediator RecR [candidate division Zixibacteria bacterium]|nr:recombination mediator RecR [candidate division Zixibacteria bacterium]